MIGILHGYLLEGSGSNIWTRNICEALARRGQQLTLICQERHPENYPFITQAFVHPPSGSAVCVHSKKSSLPGTVTLHRPEIGKTLPVFVTDKYEGFERAVPMVQLSDEELEAYIRRNVEVGEAVIRSANIKYLLANHSVLMPTVAERLGKRLGIPFGVVPHGSAIEYAVKLDSRLHEKASSALQKARTVFYLSTEMRERLLHLFPAVEDLATKLKPISVGVDTAAFKPLAKNKYRAQLKKLTNLLDQLTPGKNPRHKAVLSTLRNETTRDEYLSAIKISSQYPPKAPDAELSASLSRIAWGDAPTLLFVGRLISAKGPQALFWALPRLLAQVPRLRVIVVGQGPLREPLEAYLGALRSGSHQLAENILRWGSVAEAKEATPYFEQSLPYLDALGVPGRGELFELGRRLLNPETVLFTGFLNHGELAALYPLCDVAVFPSLVPEAGPMVLLEAMSSGCFPAGTDMAGIKAKVDSMAVHLPAEICRHARLNPTRLVEDMETNLPHLLENAAKYRTRLRDVAVREFDWQQIAAKLLTNLTSAGET